MPPELAQQLAQEMCSLRRQTALSKYLGLVLMYTSWRKGQAEVLHGYLTSLDDVMYEDPGKALQLMALPAVYVTQGAALGIRPARCRAASESASRWAVELETLLDQESDAPRGLGQLHERCSLALLSLFGAPLHLQLAQAMRMQAALNENYPQLAQQEQPRSSGVHPNNLPFSLARPANLSTEALAQVVHLAVRSALRQAASGEAPPGTAEAPRSAEGAGTPPALANAAPEVQALLFSLRERLIPLATGAPGAERAAGLQSAADNQRLANPYAKGSACKPETEHPSEIAQAQGGAIVRIFDPRQAAQLLSQQPPGSAGSEGNALLRKTLHKMAHEGGYRRIHRQEAAPALSALRARFPHFETVLSRVEAYLALSGCGQAGALVQLPPMLLRGEPGCGKTFFAQELARELGLYFVERDLSVASDAFVLSGMDSGWKNSKPGVVFDTLVHHPWANPLVCLNEVDKVKGSSHSNSPVSALYSLLEPASARQFTDEFVGMPIDASSVNWVLTANHDSVPEPILSRLDVFELSLPNAQQVRQIATSVWAELCAKSFPLGHGFEDKLSDNSLSLLQTLSPRLLRKVLQQAAAAAVQAGRRVLHATDVEQACTKNGGYAKRTTIGFLG